MPWANGSRACRRALRDDCSGPLRGAAAVGASLWRCGALAPLQLWLPLQCFHCGFGSTVSLTVAAPQCLSLWLNVTRLCTVAVLSVCLSLWMHLQWLCCGCIFTVLFTVVALSQCPHCGCTPQCSTVAVLHSSSPWLHFHSSCTVAALSRVSLTVAALSPCLYCGCFTVRVTVAALSQRVNAAAPSQCLALWPQPCGLSLWLHSPQGWSLCVHFHNVFTVRICTMLRTGTWAVMPCRPGQWRVNDFRRCGKCIELSRINEEQTSEIESQK